MEEDFSDYSSGFNPHSRTGSDIRPFKAVIGQPRRFNPHSRTGSDLLNNGRVQAVHEFQSTLPHGE